MSSDWTIKSCPYIFPLPKAIPSLVLKGKWDCKININKIFVVNERYTCNKRVYFADEKSKISNNKGVGNVFCASSSLLSQGKWFKEQVIYQLTLISLYVSWLLHCIYITSISILQVYPYIYLIYGIIHKKWHRKYQERFQIWVRLSESNKKHRGSNQEKMYGYLPALSTVRLAQMAGACAHSPCARGKEEHVFFSGHRHVKKD